MLKSPHRLIERVLALLDLAVVATTLVGMFAIGLSAQQRAALDPVTLLTLGLCATLPWPVLLEPFGLYMSQRRVGFQTLVQRLALAGSVFTGFLALVTLGLVPQLLGFAVTTAVAQTCAVGLTRLCVVSALRLLRRTGHNYRNALVVGTGPRAFDVIEVIERNPAWGVRVTGLVDDLDVPIEPLLSSYEVHKLVDVPDLLREQAIHEVIIAVPRSMLGEVAPVVAVCAEAGVPTTLLSDFFGDELPAARTTQIGLRSALTFAPVHHSQTALTIKRGLDLVGASLGLAIFAPLMGVIAIAVRRSSPGPILYRQTRSGQYGRRFRMLKFRTMTVDADQRRAELLEFNEMDGPVFKMDHDPRVTRVGRTLRRFSLDELPQLWNVLRGDMSLVGPRPPLPEEVAAYRNTDRRRLSMRPGLTCLWQVRGRNSVGFADWVKLDLQYIDNWSLAADVRILLETLPAVVRGTGR